ncbi:unnamed protein product [Paramecium sonneborni]|uniref:Uncharacterized protein n=1 Tax=Paramecium sonneborni TaxID=65129 RepID=A0A8S1QY83_9CILI|nr:unnamed protein product [Paramecium sonneborni]
MHNKSLHQDIQSLEDNDWMIFTMFSNQFNLLCNYHNILNNIHQITNSINIIKQQQFIDEELSKLLNQNFQKMDQYSINFTSAIEVFQNSLKNEKDRLDKYYNISNHLKFIQNQTEYNQTTSFGNLNYLLQLTASLQIIPENQILDSLKFYLISSFALYLITRNNHLKLRLILLQTSILFLFECILQNFLSQILLKYIRYFAMLVIQYSIIKQFTISSKEENQINAVITQIKKKYKLE